MLPPSRSYSLVPDIAPAQIGGSESARGSVLLWVGHGRGQLALARMRLTFCSEKKSAGDVTPELTRANPSMESWLPWMAVRSCCSCGGGGSSDASWAVNS